MKRKAVSGITLTILLISVVTVALYIQPIRATGTIYIRADGSVDPLTAPIHREGDIYTFTANIYESIVVERDNIIVDGAGYTLRDSGDWYSKGIEMIGRKNVTIQNMEISFFFYCIKFDHSSNNRIENVKVVNFFFGIYLFSSSNDTIVGNKITSGVGIGLEVSLNNTIFRNNITANSACGVCLFKSSNNTISENNITNNGQHGIYLEKSSSNTLARNNITNSAHGISLEKSSNNILAGNNITDNRLGMHIFYESNNNIISGNTIANNSAHGIKLEGSSNDVLRNNIMVDNRYNFGVFFGYIHDVDESNTVDGKPIYYLVNHRDLMVPSNAGYVALVNSINITVQGLELENNSQGILLSDTTNSKIANTNITNNWYGIDSIDSSNNNISENNITSNGFGIYFIDSSNNSISGNSILNNYAGICLFESSNNSISGNNIANNWEGFNIKYFSSHNSLYGNNITSNNYGIRLDFSSNNKLRSNKITSNTRNVLIEGDVISHFVNDIDTSNTINGKPMYYWVNKQDIAVPSDAGYVALVNCTRITVQNLDLRDIGQSIILAFTTNSKITQNNITANHDEGIWLFKSSNNTISKNNVANNGIGMRLDYSLNNTISGNNLTNNGAGIWLLHVSDYNNIFENNVIINYFGIVFYYSSKNNMIFHNNFIGNEHQAYFEDWSIYNIWDNEYPSGGNYWSDYAGMDLYRGPYQNETGNDEIGDTPYIIDQNNADRYPLTNPWAPIVGIRDVAILNVKLSATQVHSGSTVNINVTIKNNGEYSENRTLTVYYNSTPIETQTIALASGETATLTFIWNTKSVALGNHTIKAVANIVLGEINITDNTFANGFIKVKIQGDVNGDNKVDMKDIGLAAKAFGETPDRPRWSLQADINQDNKIDMKDIAIIAKNFGKP